MTAPDTNPAPTPLIDVQGVSRRFELGRSMGDILRGRYPSIDAVSDVSLTLHRGEAVGIVGESGCGKSTLGRILVKLIPPSGGQVVFDGEKIENMDRKRELAFRRRAQLVFQNPFDALNAHFTIRRSLYEPLHNAKIPLAEHDERVAEAIRMVHLPSADHILDSYPHQLSGGQLQRIVLARALVLRPEFIVADEPVSMLDVSVRAGILNVFRQIQRDMGLAAVFISHDLALVRYVCERTITMYLGTVVEDGPTSDVISEPLHPYTRALVAAVPVPNVNQSHAPLPIKGGIPDARNPPSGCRFRDRCPIARDRCASERPVLREARAGHKVACHYVDRPAS